jgi:hypothetical protein
MRTRISIPTVKNSVPSHDRTLEMESSIQNSPLLMKTSKVLNKDQIKRNPKAKTQ